MVEINPQFLDSLTYAAKTDRQILRDFITEGILTSTALQVTESDTPAMSVKVAAGVAFVQNDSGADRGHYRIYNDAAVTKTIAASDPSNPRKDRVIAQVYDAIDIGGSDNKWVIEVLTGTPAASPSAPALPNNALDLAIVDVAAAATTITNANITDQRALSIFGNFISQLVQLTGNQTKAGVLTFSDAPVINGISISSGLTDKTRHINLTAAGAIIPATNGAEQAQVNGTNHSYYVLNFDKTTDEKAYWHFVVPDTYDGGNCTFKVWAKTTVTTGNVMWVIKTVGIADAATLDSALSTSIAFDAKAVDPEAGDVFVASKAADPGWTAGQLAIIELSRDADHASDTADADVSVVIIEVEWEVT